MGCRSLELPSRYSVTSVFAVRPLTSRNAATASDMLVISTRKLNPRNGSTRSPVDMTCPSWGPNGQSSATLEPPIH